MIRRCTSVVRALPRSDSKAVNTVPTEIQKPEAEEALCSPFL